MKHPYAGRTRVRLVDPILAEPRYSSRCQEEEMEETPHSKNPPHARDLKQLENEAGNPCADFEVDAEPGRQFFKQVPSCLTSIRLQLGTLARAQSPAKKGACLASLSMECRWLAEYGRSAGFLAVSQFSAALEALSNELKESSEDVSQSQLRALAQAADLLSSLTTTAPEIPGRAEGAKVLVIDGDGRSRGEILTALEASGILGIGISTESAAIGSLKGSSVDLIILQANASTEVAVKLCQDIRRLPAQQKTPILVLSSESDWETRALFAISGATEVFQGAYLHSELTLRTLAHFFKGRLSGRT